jgi:mannose-6-phosphate isomerase-like protein (cupin superfamily)
MQFQLYQQSAGPVINIERETRKNNAFRRVVWTTPQQQMVFMSLQPQEEIGLERHLYATQFLRIEQGVGLVQIEGEEYEIYEGDAILVPANTLHNVINLSEQEQLKLYTIYSPPMHAPALVQNQRPAASSKEEEEDTTGINDDLSTSENASENDEF